MLSVSGEIKRWASAWFRGEQRCPLALNHGVDNADRYIATVGVRDRHLDAAPFNVDARMGLADRPETEAGKTFITAAMYASEGLG